MAKRKQVEEAVDGPLEGTVEHARLQHFEKEKAAYEERTGETVNYQPDAPLTSTPIVEVADVEEDPAEPAPEAAEGEG
jgi:hypothetical protein